MIICYHKNRKKFYVVKDNTKANRKWLFHSGEVYDCVKYCAANGCRDYTMARSAVNVLTSPMTRGATMVNINDFLPGVMPGTEHLAPDTHPSRPTPPSDAVARDEGRTYPDPETGVRHPSDEREEDK